MMEIGNRPLWEQYALAMFGGIPRGTFAGILIMENPDVPSDRIRLVDPQTGAYTECAISETAQARNQPTA